MYTTHLEQVQLLLGVDTRLLVAASNQSILGLLVRHQRGNHLQLQALCNLVLQLDVCSQDVRRSPGLSQGGTALLVGPLGFQITLNLVTLGVANTLYAEGDIVGCLGLDVKAWSVDRAARGIRRSSISVT